MGKNILRVLSLGMLLMMLAATASAATVTNRDELVAALTSNASLIQIDLEEFSVVDNDGNFETIKIDNTVNTTIEFSNGSESTGVWITSYPFIEFGGANSNVTTKGFSMSASGVSPTVFVLSGGNSVLTLDHSNIMFTNTSGYYSGTLVEFTSDDNELIITDRNFISVSGLGEYGEGTSHNIVKVPYNAKQYDETTGESLYRLEAGDKYVHNIPNWDWETVTNGTAYNHTDLQYIASTSTCSSYGKKAHYYCSVCQNHYYDEYGLQWTSSVEDDESYNWDNHVEYQYIAADLDDCGNGTAAHYECVDCTAAFYDAEGKKPAPYEDLITVGSNHDLVTIPAGNATCSTPKILKTFYTCDKCENAMGYVDGVLSIITEDAWSEYIDYDSEMPPHELTYVPYKAPTETEDGNYEYYVCSVCEGWLYWDEEDEDYYEYYDKNEVIIPAGTSDHEHVRKWVEATSATETVHGYEGHYECETCGKWFDDWAMTEEITDKDSLLRHKNGYRFAEDKASCEERVPRVDHIVCEVSGCGRFFTDYTYEEELTEDEALWPIGNHIPVKEDYVAPTETEEGSKEYYWCDECYRMFWDEDCTDEFLNEDEIIIPKADHTHKPTTVAEVPATESSTGVKAHYKCEGCGKLFTDEACTIETTLEALTIPMLEHTHKPVKHDAVAPTVGTDGNIEYYSCEGCDKLFADEACTKEITETDLILHIHGNPETIDLVEPSYTEAGVKAHYKCTCGKLFEDEECTKETTLENLAIPKLIEVENGSATVEDGAIADSVKNAGANKVISVPVSSVENAEKVTVSSEDLEAVMDAGLAIEFEMSTELNSANEEKHLEATLDNKLLTAALEKAVSSDSDVNIVLTTDVEKNDGPLDSKQKETLSAEGKTALVFTGELKVGNETISDFEGGVAEIWIPFELKPGKNTADFKLFYIAKQGTEAEEIEDFQLEDGYLKMQLKHFSNYVLVDTNPEIAAVDAAAEDLPETGDNSSLMLWMGLLMISLCAYVAVRKVRA